MATMESNKNPGMPEEMPSPSDARGYALSGKIMLTAVVVLFFVVVLMVLLHLYARWFLVRARRRHLRRRARRTHLVFYVDPSIAAPAAPLRGLDPAVLKSLPVFVYSAGEGENHDGGVPECAVCLSEFEGGEAGRLLPNCGHSFHTDCIDMWFHTHSTCPLCRSPVDPPENPIPAAPAADPEAADPIPPEDTPAVRPGPSCAEGTSSLGTLRKPPALAVAPLEVPMRRAESFIDVESPASQGGFRSPMSRVLSLTRILSRETRRMPSPRTAAFSGEPDLECGNGPSAL